MRSSTSSSPMWKRTLGPFAEPARDPDAGRLMRREPHSERAQAPQREIHIVGADAEPHRAHRVMQARPLRLTGRDRAQHRVGMATDIFGAGLDREVDALGKRAEIKR